jgi:TolB-like protein/class 3 adenylate cyclase/Flp pilus assembly protein TadD
MVDEGFKRKLTSILSADAVGYSRLMEDDEEATVRTITSYREVIATLIKQHNGMVIDSPGDNLLAEFVSVVDAVQCAVSVQNEINARNEDLPENRKMQFRIGINLGDVIQEGERIYGDGVNIAARLEGLAAPGGICISKSAFDQIERKLPYGYEYIGDQTVKNISKPIGAYRVMLQPRVTVAGEPEKEKPAPGRRKALFVGVAALLIVAVAIGIWQFYTRRPTVEPASEEKMAFPLPDKPSIAVLPFVNMSDDPKQEYFSDGITEDLITDLSKISGLFVIARNSAFTYKGRPVKIRQVAEELGVRYVLEGSVRKASEKVRITAQLIDATAGHHIWADRYDGNVGDVFGLQDMITRKIIAALALKLAAPEQEQISRRDTDNPEAYSAFLQGLGYYRQYKAEDLAQAVTYFKKAIELDPNYSLAYSELAVTYWDIAVNFHWPKLGMSLWEVKYLARKYLKMAMKNPTSRAYRLMGEMALTTRQYETAIAGVEQAIALDPNLFTADRAYILTLAGRPEDGLEMVKKAIRHDPHHLTLNLWNLGLANFCLGRFEEAATAFGRGFKLNPEFVASGMGKIASYALLGRDQEAQESYNAYLDARAKMGRKGEPPPLSIGMYWFPFRNRDIADRFATGLLKVGWPGDSSYYKIYEENKLTGEELSGLIYGHTITGVHPVTNEQWWIQTSLNGESMHRGARLDILFSKPMEEFSDKGKMWLEEDMLWSKWEKLFDGFEFYKTIFRNPESSPDNKAKIIADDERYVFYENGIVYDKKTKLDWIAGPDTDTTWHEARSWIRNLRVDGDGWRLPIREEVKTLYKKGAGTNNINPVFKTTGWWVWFTEKWRSYVWQFRDNYGREWWPHTEPSKDSRVFAVRPRYEYIMITDGGWFGFSQLD